MKYLSLAFLVALLVVANTCAVVAASDWPTYQHDSRRTGVTGEQLDLPLTELWVWTPTRAPQPAWPDPAKADYWHNKVGLLPRVTFDRTFHVVAVGDSVYFGSSANDKVYALNAATGKEQWSFFTDGPVRLAPSVSEGKVYIGSDDGRMYCLDGATGELVWKHRPVPIERQVVGNGRMMSLWPVRTGVLVEDGVAYFCAGLFPAQGLYVCAVDAADGSELWSNGPVYELDRLSPQGYLLASETKLYVPAGRGRPVVLDRRDGTYVRTLNSTGGTYALLTKDMLVSGPASSTLTLSEEAGDTFATFQGRRMIVTEQVSYLLTDTELCALDRVKRQAIMNERNTISADRKKLAARLSDLRKKRADASTRALKEIDKEITHVRESIVKFDRRLKELRGSEYKWRQPCNNPDSMILAGNVLFAGGDGAVVAFDTANGDEVWTGKVMGRAYGLAVANGRLFVSTDSGAIHCFRAGASAAPAATLVPDKRPPYPEDQWTQTYASAAEHIVNETGIRKGYCLVVGCGEGRLAYELARRTDLNVIGVEEDAGKVAAARTALDRAGLYGDRITVHHGSLSDLPYSDYFANLVVADDMLTSGTTHGSLEEIRRVLRPCGGVAYLGQTVDSSERGGKLDRSRLESWIAESAGTGWKTIDENGLWAVNRRGKLDGSGEWTHQYADPGHSAYSGDQLLRSPMEVLWFGQPGPRDIIDRHHRGMVPLSKDGRLFVPGDDRVTVVDAYNGFPLWDVVVPNSRRVGAQRDAGGLAVTDDYLYAAAEDKCYALDVATGERSLTFEAPQLVPGTRYHWGYVASVDDLLFGSGKKQSASYTEVSRAGDIAVQFSDFGKLVTSHYLFCLDRRTGDTRWTYKNGAIVNPTIAAGDDRIYFVESDSQRALKDDVGRVTLQVLLKGTAELVSLDMRTGKRLWSRPLDITETCNHILFLNYAKDTVLLTGTSNKNRKVHYHLYAFEAETGEPMWYREHFHPFWPVGGDHGEQTRHPVIMDDVIYAEPYAYHLKTGEPVTRVHPVTGEEVQWDIYRGHGCGTFSASDGCLFYRSTYQAMNDLQADAGPNTLTGIRPGCWINMVPAGGMLLVPEGSSGCTCPFPIQTSVAYYPTQRKENWSAFQSHGDIQPVKHLAVNLGAPGDQRAKDGTLWFSFPRPPDGRTVKLPIEVQFAEGSGYFRENADAVSVQGTDEPWVFTSGCSGSLTCSVPVTGKDRPGLYTVRLGFAELSDVPVGQRVFDVKLQGKVVLDKFDVVKAAGAANTAVVKEFTDIAVNDALSIELVPKVSAPVLNGFEIIRQDG